jgi:hypothetical protein
VSWRRLFCRGWWRRGTGSILEGENRAQIRCCRPNLSFSGALRSKKMREHAHYFRVSVGYSVDFQPASARSCLICITRPTTSLVPEQAITSALAHSPTNLKCLIMLSRWSELGLPDDAGGYGVGNVMRPTQGLQHQLGHAHGNKRGRTRREPFKMKRDKHFVFETKIPRTDCSGPQNPSVSAARSMLS